MAPPVSAETEQNPYELLGISTEATEAEIRTAYRTRSLKVHPDRNRNDPNAAQKFHALTAASQLLLDPLRRLALNAQLRLAAAKKARFAAYDTKRKNLVTELEEREREFKRARMEKEKEKAAREEENDRVKETGRRLREEKERERMERERIKVEETRVKEDQASDAEAPPPLGPYDTTIRVKFALSAFPILSTPSALASHFKRFGEIDEDAVVLSIKAKKASNKKKTKVQETFAQEALDEGEKVVNAVVPFAQIGAAFGVISSSVSLKEQGMDVSWVGGTEPPILGWLRDRGELSGRENNNIPTGIPPESTPRGAQESPESPRAADSGDRVKFSTFPSTFPATFPSNSQATSTPSTRAMDFESITLLRLREAERARLEREILEAEAKEQEA